MRSAKTRLLLSLICILFMPLAVAQQISVNQQIWSADVIRPSGQPVIPLFDGWFLNADGTRTLCYSFFNLNTEQSLTIPLGEKNYLSDDRFSAQLPTHFDPLPPRYRHKFCVFTVTVPADFSVNETIVWHLSSANEDLSVPGHIKAPFVLDEPSSAGRGEIAPLIKFTKNSEGVRGRKGSTRETPIVGRVGEAVELSAWIEHPDEEVWVGWAKHAGPGTVGFDEIEYTMAPNGEPARVQATFSEPGRYLIRLQSINDTAAFEFYCCHSNAYINVDIN